VHSRRQRKPGDLPLAGRAVQFSLQIRRFFCDNAGCTKRTFAEQVPSLLPFHARRTVRQTELLTEQAFALGGEAGARTLDKMGVTVSPDTLLRLISKTPLPLYETPRVLGVDDWAFRKGRTYGTILVDLEKRQVVDLLPERSAESLATWLRSHPGVEIVSRDRASCYAEGIQRGAPHAQQVADRWHLLKNLNEHLSAFFARRTDLLGQLTPSSSKKVGAEASPELTSAAGAPRTVVEEQKNTEIASIVNELTPQLKPITTSLPSSRKRLHFEQIKELYGQGYSERSIARALGVSRNTVKKYLGYEESPRYSQRAKRPSLLDPYKTYLSGRWKEGCRNGQQLYGEIKEQGYRGKWGIVRIFLAEQHTRFASANSTGVKPVAIGELRTEQQQEPRQNQARKGRKWKLSQAQTVLAARRLLSPKQAAWLLVKAPASLEGREQELVTQLQNLQTQLAQLYTLSQQFVAMVKNKAVEGQVAAQLEDWLTKADKLNNRELNRFANGIRRDKAAVVAGLSSEWSNGQVEGQVNRLKMLKRQTYGRAGFALLKARVLRAA
jgi:transposase